MRAHMRAIVLLLLLLGPVPARPQGDDDAADEAADRVNTPHEPRHYKDANGFDVEDDGVVKIISIPRNVVEAPGPGWPSATELKSQGYTYLDRQTREYVKLISGCRYEVGYRDDAQRLQTFAVQLECLGNPHVTATVEENAGKYIYRYTLTNGAAAQQSLFWFQVTIPKRDIVDPSRDPQAWERLDHLHLFDSGSSLLDWMAPTGAPLLTPGASVSGLSATSAYLPAVADALIRVAESDTDDNRPTVELSYELEEAISAVSETRPDVSQTDDCTGPGAAGGRPDQERYGPRPDRRRQSRGEGRRVDQRIGRSDRTPYR
jgi:hypothetical protein